MDKTKIGFVLIIIGAAAALLGAIFYQNALAGVIYQVHIGTELIGAFIANMQLLGVMVVGGIIVVIIGVGMAFFPKL